MKKVMLADFGIVATHHPRPTAPKKKGPYKKVTKVMLTPVEQEIQNYARRKRNERVH